MRREIYDDRSRDVATDDPLAISGLADRSTDGRAIGERLPKAGPAVDLADRVEAGLQRIEDLRYRPAVGLALAGCLVLGFAAWWYLAPAEPTAVEEAIAYASVAASSSTTAVADDGSEPAVAKEGQETGAESGSTVTALASGGSVPTSSAIEQIVVHVVGAVRRPGLVYVEGNARVADAIDAAGGLKAEADSQLLNLASLVQDGTQIMVPSIGEEVTSPLIRPSEYSVPINSDSELGTTSSVAININTASQQELMSLPGIGPSIAQAIVTWRDENGLFLTVEDLEFVPGIGPAKLDGLKDEVIV